MIILWIVLCFIVGIWGNSRKIGFWKSFILSLLLSPIIGFIFVALSERKSDIKMKEDISSTNRIIKIKELSDLKDKGAISQEEFEKLKKEIIGNDSPTIIDPFKK